MAGISVINLVITMQYFGDDETMNSIDYGVTDELAIPKVTAQMVKEGMGEFELSCVGYMPSRILCAVGGNYSVSMEDVSQYKLQGGIY